MKKLFLSLLAAALIFVLFSCGSEQKYTGLSSEKAEETTENPTENPETDADPDKDKTAILTPVSVSVANSSRVDYEKVVEKSLNSDLFKRDGSEGEKHLAVFRMEKAEDLGNFLKDVKNDISLDFAFVSGYKSIKTLLQEYGEEFFADNDLFLSVIRSPGLEILYGVKSVSVEKGTLIIDIEQTNSPDAISTLETCWIFAVALKKTDVADCTGFDSRFVGDRTY